jgi:hypothetical protein
MVDVLRPEYAALRCAAQSGHVNFRRWKREARGAGMVAARLLFGVAMR